MSLVGWKYSKEIIIDNTGNDTSYENNLICINLTPNNFNFDKARFDGSDIRFTDSDGTTLLDYWIERYDIDNQIAIIYVKIPLLPANQTKSIYMWYGNPNATSIADRSVVSYKRINYLTADPFNDNSCVAYYPFDGNANDYSEHYYHGTWYGNEQYDDGLFGQCAKFDGNSYITRRGPVLGRFPSRFTVSLWLHSGGSGYVLQHGCSYNTSHFGISLFDDMIKVSTRESGWSNILTARASLYGGWNFIAATYSYPSNSLHLFVNGVLRDSCGVKPLGWHDFLCFGAEHIEGARLTRTSGYKSFFTGKIDNVHIFNRVLTEEEIRTLYFQYFLYSFSNEQQHKSKLFGVACDKYGIPIVDKPVKVYILNKDYQTLITSTTTTTGHWKFNNFPADPGSKVLVVYSLEGQYHDDNDIAGATFKETV